MSCEAVSWARTARVGDATRKAVLFVLAERANTSGECFPGQESIAADAGVSSRTVRAVLAEFEVRGVIMRTKRFAREGRGRTSDLIRLNLEWTDQPEPASTGTSFHRNVSPPENPVEKPTTNRQIASDQPAALAREVVREPVSKTRTSQKTRVDNADAVRLAGLMADLLASEGDPRPRVTDAWIADMDKLVRIDGRAPDEVERTLRWLQAAADPVSAFWGPNVRSPKKLREKWAQMRQQYRLRVAQPDKPTGLTLEDMAAQVAAARRSVPLVPALPKGAA